jgi:hypothetical protein
LLKISRNLYSTTSSFGKGLNAGGFSTNNYPNGLEITSYIPAIPSSGPSANKSVAIAVGSTNIISPATGANTTGFFVSDTGQNISIGQYIDDTAAIGVSGAGSDYSIKAKGAVGVTGNVEVIGNLGVTGDTTLRTGVVTIYDSSPTIADFTLSGGKINNDTKTLHHNLTTDPPGGIVYLSPGGEVVSSGNFSYASNGTVVGTWTKVGQVVQVYGVWTATSSNQFFVPVQPAGGATISNLNGVANQDNVAKAWRVIQAGTTNARIYQDGNPVPTGGEQYSFVISYLIS